MTDLYPFNSHFFQATPTARLHYLDEGTGDPVVMVHGNPTWSFYYRNLVIALRGSHRVIVPDHVGCGLSDKPDDAHYAYTLAQRANDLEKWLDHLDIKSGITLVVHDWGGMIGMVYATRHPERIRRLVILNTGAFHLPKSKLLPWSLWWCRNTPFGPFLIRGLNGFSRSALTMCVTRRPLSAEVKKMYLMPYDSWDHRRAVLRFVQDIPLRSDDPSYELVTQTQDNLHKLRGVPMLICWGDRDFVFDAHFLAEWQRRFPEAEVHRFADAGHYVLEDAVEEIAPLVQRFLAVRETVS